MAIDLDFWRYENLPPVDPNGDWSPATKGDRPYDQLDFHLDLGCGTVKKARLGIDRFDAPGVDLLVDLDRLVPSDPSHPPTVQLYRHLNSMGVTPLGPCLPFPNDSIKSIVTHHCLEHIGDGFITLMDECHRVLEPGGIFRIIVPLFPSYNAVMDPDHRRYFCEGIFEAFCGARDGRHWQESFAVPYTSCRFQILDEDLSPRTPVEDMWYPGDAREMRVALRKWE